MRRRTHCRQRPRRLRKQRRARSRATRWSAAFCLIALGRAVGGIDAGGTRLGQSRRDVGRALLVERDAGVADRDRTALAAHGARDRRRRQRSACAAQCSRASRAIRWPSPGLLGVSAGASLGAVIAIYFGISVIHDRGDPGLRTGRRARRDGAHLRARPRRRNAEPGARGRGRDRIHVRADPARAQSGARACKRPTRS